MQILFEWKLGSLSISQINRLKPQYSSAPPKYTQQLESLFEGGKKASKKRHLKKGQGANVELLDIEKGRGSPTLEVIKGKTGCHYF